MHQNLFPARVRSFVRRFVRPSLRWSLTLTVTNAPLPGADLDDVTHPSSVRPASALALRLQRIPTVIG